MNADDSPTVTIARGLYLDLRTLYRAARGVRNIMHALTRKDVQPCDWKFAKEVRKIFPTMDILTSITSLLETKMFADGDKCPSCGANLT